MNEFVLDTTRAYRQLVDAISFPGSVQELAPIAKKYALKAAPYPATLLLCRMLLDAEVKFSVVGVESKADEALLSKLTYGIVCDLPEADFIVAKDSDWTALGIAKIGTLVDPHRSATVLAQVDSLTAGTPYRLRGPGIETEQIIRIQSDADWLTLFHDRNREFPLGVDFYFLDREDRLLVIPRAVSVEEVA